MRRAEKAWWRVKASIVAIIATVAVNVAIGIVSVGVTWPMVFSQEYGRSDSELHGWQAREWDRQESERTRLPPSRCIARPTALLKVVIIVGF